MSRTASFEHNISHIWTENKHVSLRKENRTFTFSFGLLVWAREPIMTTLSGSLSSLFLYEVYDSEFPLSTPQYISWTKWEGSLCSHQIWSEMQREIHDYMKKNVNHKKPTDSERFMNSTSNIVLKSKFFKSSTPEVSNRRSLARGGRESCKKEENQIIFCCK